MGTKLGKDIILQVFRYLYLYDVVALMFADVLSYFTAAATELALPLIAEFDLHVGTVYSYNGKDDDDYEYTQPVIRKIKSPTARNLPRECMIFEPEHENVRHSYRRGRFEPTFVELRWRRFTFPWTLKPG